MSQCTTAAQCLKELARVMEQFGIDNPITATKSKYVRYAQEHWSSMPIFNTPSDWSFAIAEVEGKPVFVDSPNLYHKEGSNVPVSYIAINLHKWSWSDFSWNPPKPKTIMVELLVEDVKFWDSMDNYFNDKKYIEASKNFKEACRQALEREGVKS